MQTPAIILSINKTLVNKGPPDALRSRAPVWVSYTLPMSGLVAEIRDGHSFAPQYKNQYRKGSHFLSCGFIAADVDDGMTIDEARDNAFIHTYGAFIYTTASHTDQHHRFRVVFALQAPVTDGHAWSNANFGLAHKLGSDPAIGDAARCFFGSTSAQVWMNDQTMPMDVFEELAAYGAELRAARKQGYPINSTQKVAGDSLVKLASGEMTALEKLTPGTSIHCPYHDDRKPSAFVVRSWKHSSLGIHCRACMCTRWQAEDSEYDFFAFEKLVERRVGKEAAAEDNPDGEGLAKYFPPEPKFTIHQERYLPAFPYEPGITMVKSPKGSGKTEVLKKLLQELADGIYKQGIEKKDRIKSIVLIGHRRALLSATSERLGLKFYLNPDTECEAEEGLRRFDVNSTAKSESKIGSKLETLAVCLDSLPAWNEPYVASFGPGYRPIFKQDDPHDLVIIDESEQVFRHLMGGTIAKKCGGVARCFDALEYEIANAKGVIVLDADLGMLTAHALKELRPQDWHSRTRVIYNKPVPPDKERTLRLYNSETALRHEVFKAIERGERCFVACNSKKMAKVIEEMIKKRFGGGVKMRTITSDNSREADEIEFVKNIKSEILKIQVLICSPSLGTGIDITFPDPTGAPGGACLVDQVFGFFYPLVNTHTDMDQQLFRVRNPGSVKVWISHARFSFSSNFDVVRDDIARAYYVPRAVSGRTPDGLVNYNPLDPLLLICTHVTASQRASKNRLIELFCQLRESQGWKIERDTSTPALTKERKEAEKAIWNKNAKGLLSAPVLDDDELFDLTIREQNGEHLSQPEKLAYERNTLERALGVDLTYEIIKLNYDGLLLGRVSTLSRLTKRWADFGQIQSLLADESNFLVRMSKQPPDFMLNCIFTLCGLAAAQGIDSNIQIEASDLLDFARVCQKNRTVLEDILGNQIRKDVEKNPVRQANIFLKLAGLKLEAIKRRKDQGKGIRVYGFDVPRLNLMMSLAVAFKDPVDIKAELLERAKAA